MHQVSLRLKDRASGTEVPYEGRALYDEEYLHERQDALSDIYKQFDILCDCQPGGVRMHVKYRLDTGNYYLADNRSSPKHREGCELEKSSRLLESDDDTTSQDNANMWELPKTYSLLASPSTVKSSAQSASGSKPGVARPDLFKRLIYTLLDESFATFFHGSTTTPYTVANQLNEKADVLAAHAPANSNLPFKVHYGHRGHMTLGRQLMALKRNGEQGFALWFEKADEFYRKNNEFHYCYQGEWRRCQLACSVPDTEIAGPYFIAGLLATPQGEGEWVELRSLIIIPLVDHHTFIGVNSDAERDYLQDCASTVKSNRLMKLYVGRTFRPWYLDGAYLAPPIYLGRRTNPRKRVITTLENLNMEKVNQYEYKFNAPVCSPAFALRVILQE